MTTMIAEVYEAFISVGIKAEKAKAAAIALSREAKTESQEVKTDLKEDIQEIKIRIQKMDKELAVLKWMLGGYFILCIFLRLIYLRWLEKRTS